MFPLLRLPDGEKRRRDKLPRAVPNRLTRPSAAEQRARLTPRFEEVARAFSEHLIAGGSPALGEPELVVVFETAGTVTGLASALGRISGFEWLQETADEDAPPDQFFSHEDDPDALVPRTLYLVMASPSSVEEIISLWRRYLRRPTESMPYGFGPFKELFARLDDVRRWSPTDRVARTGLHEEFEKAVVDERGVMTVEIELWHRRDFRQARTALERTVVAVEQLGGVVLKSASFPEAAYTALLADLDVEAVERVLELDEIRLVRSDDVMVIRPAGQFVAPPPDDPPGAASGVLAPQPTEGIPLVALFDGMPLENHELLAGHLVVDDPDGLGVLSAPPQRLHGTAMASLIVHGDVGVRGAPLTTPVYVRPILAPDPADWRALPSERVPTRYLFPDLLVSAVRRLLAGPDPVGPDIRILNISVCDGRPFLDAVSPAARVLDWLAWEFGLFITVSAGNYPSDLELRTGGPSPRDVPDAALRPMTLAAMDSAVDARPVLSPADAINVTSVGAAHSDATAIPRELDLLPGRESFPSPLNPVSRGHRGAIKPEILTPAGRQPYRSMYTGDGVHTASAVRGTGRPPGLEVAAPGAGSSTDALAGRRWIRGTSGAAALAAREAARCLPILRGVMWGGPGPDRHVEAALLRALVAHRATWGDASEDLLAFAEGQVGRRRARSAVARYLGYGTIPCEQDYVCGPGRVTLLGCGRLGRDEAQLHRMPLPPSLSGVVGHRRVTVTCSWLSPLRPHDLRYRGAKVWFSTPEGLEVTRSESNWQAVRRGTLQHEVLTGEQASVFVDGEALGVQVNCAADAGPLGESVPYGVAITLEVAEALDIPIYAEVRERLRQRVRA